MLSQVHDLTSTAGIVAMAAGAVAVVSLATNVFLAVRLRRVRADQRVVLGGRAQDLVAHAAALESQFEALSQYVQDAALQLDERMSTAEQRLDGAVAYRALVRYDAYGEMSGRQSTSIALLDANRSGLVLSSIHHREQARLYAKQVRHGRSELELSPEEDEAIRIALEGDDGTARHGVRGQWSPACRLLRSRGHVHARGADRRHRRAELEPSAFGTIYDTVMAVHPGAVERAFVPIENSLEGSVNVTLDTLAMETEDVAIVGEVVHPIRQCLIAGASLSFRRDRGGRLACPGHRAVRSVHPDPPTGPEVLTGGSTAEAVQMVAEHEGPWAALGTRLAASPLRLLVLRAGVEDVPGNETRFVWLARPGRSRGRRVPISPAGGPWKTAIVFWGPGAEAPGWLVRCLSEFASREVNLTRIESRPRKQGLGRYMFFADLEGTTRAARGGGAARAGRHGRSATNAGSFPALDRAGTGATGRAGQRLLAADR